MSASLTTWTNAELRSLHAALLGRDTGLRSRSKLIESLQERRVDHHTTHVVKIPQRASVFRGVRLGRWRGDNNADTPEASQPKPRRVTSLLIAMGVDLHANDSLIQEVREFIRDPKHNTRQWIQRFAAMRERVTSPSYLRLLALALRCTAPSAHLKTNTHGDKLDPHHNDVTEPTRYDDVVKKRQAEWELDRVFERGASYFTEVWKGVNRKEMIASCEGSYFIHNAATLHARQQRVVRRGRLRQRLQSLRLHSAKPPNESPDDASDTQSSDNFEGDDGGDDADVCTLHVVIDDKTGLAHLSFSLSPSQYAEVISSRTNADSVTSTSPLLFRAQAGCVGVDRWLVFTDGLWKNKLIDFVRRMGEVAAQPKHIESIPVDAAVVDEIIFSKRHLAPPTKPSDVFVCVTCTAERVSNNYVYSTKYGDLRRGLYHCAICMKRTLHVRKEPADEKPMQWVASLSASARQEPYVSPSKNQYGH